MIGKLLRKNKGGEKKPAAAPTAAPVTSDKSAQGWMPVKDVYNGFIHRKDGTLIAAIRIQPVNFNLLSETEKLRKIKALEEVLNGLDQPFQIISIARPVDLDAYIASLDEMKSNVTDRIKSRLLAGYMTHAAAMATSGEALERQFYILLDQPVSKNGQKDEANLFRRATELSLSFSGADLSGHVCNDEELRDLLFIFTNPNQAAYERAPVTQMILPTLFMGEE
ncbi:hypothetical protein [Paenibacillus tyrfis]|uniref:hypothetical protein n=1 Tax=Paenibacillus tyrfis TaxID=1501230 RepID=UPI0020A1B441|nr:hypothetical protein [Paenibacillus tyrfis]MCP1312092.1 hypothetical protein [Paenibacillus tyrfis]